MITILAVFVVVAVAKNAVLGDRLEASLIGKDSGFFMKPFYPLRNNASVEEWPFVAFVGARRVRASFGPYETIAPISQKTLYQAISNHSSVLNFQTINGFGVSAHLVTETIVSDRPRLQVLFHSTRLENEENPDGAEPAAKGRGGRPSGTREAATTSDGAAAVAPNLCLVLFAFKDNEVRNSFCKISDVDGGVCIADIVLPKEWWNDRLAQTTDVLYSVYDDADSGSPCGPGGAPLKRLGRNSGGSNDRRTFLAAVTLTHGQMNYQELKEDQHILIYVPQASFYPGSKFTIPVKLQAESDLQMFVIKVKAKHGIKVGGAEAKNGSHWTINVDTNARKQVVMVTAYVVNKEAYTKTDKIQDIFDWLLEVESDLSASDQGRLSFSIEYEMTSKRKETYGGSIENKAVARIQIQQDNTFAIVPVIKTTELVNVAGLTGIVQNYPLTIYSVSHAGKIADITSQTTCHSGDEDVLQITESCRYVYLNGHETKGSSSVSVIAKYGRHTRFLFFRVWIPEFPLDVDLSDNKLSLVSGWKVPLYGGFSRKSANVEPAVQPQRQQQQQQQQASQTAIASEPDRTSSGSRRKEDAASLSCQLRYQSAVVEVYARFVMSDVAQNPYMLHRKAQFRVTDLVRDRLVVLDHTVAQLRGNVVDGLKPGRTDVQVLSHAGGIVATKELRVSSDRVNVEKLDVSVVAALDLTVGAKLDFPGAISARIVKTGQLNRKRQEAILDVVVRYDDGTTLPLDVLPTNDYTIDADELKPSVVRLSPLFSEERLAVVAVATGSGDLVQVRLAPSSDCPVTKSRSLGVGYARVDVNVVSDAAQNDASHLGYDSRNRNVGGGVIPWNDKDPTGGDSDEGGGGDDKKKGKGRSGNGKNRSGGGKSPTGRQLNEGSTSTEERDDEVPRIEAQKQPLSDVHGMSSVETAMYVLLAVFCVAIVVFTVNCMLFVARHRLKGKDPDAKDPVTEVQDWVWIGRETLERNSVNTTCSRTLMPEADFNGNHSPPGGGGGGGGCLYLAPPPDGGGSNRNSRCSNRSSQVSTYKGSECSIRITSNLLADDNDNVIDGVGGGGGGAAVPSLERYRLPPQRCDDPDEEEEEAAVEDVKMEDEEEEEEEMMMDEGNVVQNHHLVGGDSRPLIEPRSNGSAATMSAPSASAETSVVGVGPQRSTLSREERLRQLEEAIASGSDVDWDYDEIGMTYDELMDYFDNLKESTA